MKLTNWATRLDEYVAGAASMPFSYNRAMGMDCCTFTFGAIHAQTGTQVGLRFVGQYSTKREALQAMKNYCGKASLGLFISTLMKEFSFDAIISPLYAQRGDAVLVPNGSGDSFVGVLDLNGRDVLGVGEGGIRRIPISTNCRAWRIA